MKPRRKPIPEEVWKSVDWDKSTKEISEQLDAAPSTVSRYRRLYAVSTVGTTHCTRSTKQPDWDSIDWSQSTQLISEKYGVRTSAVSHRRRMHAPHTLGQYVQLHGYGKDREDVYRWWDSIDWSLSNKELATLHNKNRSTVSNRRNVHAPETIRK